MTAIHSKNIQKGDKSVSLVLGSGGARGLAHIGVIHELQEQGYQIRSIAGCSMGALIGGIFAAGKLDEFERWVSAVTKVDIVALLDISWGKKGLVKGDKIISTLVDLVGDKTIEELDIPFTAVAADVKNEKEVWINSGRLFDAIRASISLPLFFTPVKYKEGYLIDGGVLNPVPIAPTFNDETDITVAVNLGGPVELIYENVEKDNPANSKPSQLHEKIVDFVSQLKDSVVNSDDNDWGAFDVANEAFDAMQSAIARQKLAAYPPDIVIEIARNACGTLEFDRADEMIQLGRMKAKECLLKMI
jgi:NTE family protein